MPSRHHVEADTAFAELSTIVLGKEPLPGILERVVQIANQVLPADTEASMTLIAAAGPATVAFTGQIALALDERQYEADAGPCLHAASVGDPVVVPDMVTEHRWPHYASAAADNAVRSSLSVPLPVQRDLTGALNFYSPHPDAFRRKRSTWR